MNKFCRSTLMLTAALLAASIQAENLRIPLTVSETSGSGRPNELVSFGVPLLPGQCSALDKLRILDDKGKEVRAQFRQLSRWWRKDNSLRWVLVDFQVGMGGHSSRTFTLTDGRAAAYESPLMVKETDAAIIVTTGVAEFTINRKNFNLFDRVRIDTNGDGKYTEDEEAVSPNPTSGSVVEDTYGQKYLSSEGTREVKVEEQGPVRVCVVAKGVHKAPAGKGFSRGMYGYDVRLHFMAGTSMVRLDPVIHAGLPEPIGSPTFEDYSLVVKLNMKGEVNANPQALDRKSPTVLSRVYGNAPLDIDLKEGQSTVIYQDSNGTESWEGNTGYGSFGSGGIGKAQFRGYRILRNGPAKQQVVTCGDLTLRHGEDKWEKDPVIASGDHARGVVEFHGSQFGAIIIPRYFWRLFPKAIEVGFDGTLRVGVLPREYNQVHWLTDAGGAGQELWIYFFARKLKSPAHPLYARDTSTKNYWWSLMRYKPWPHHVADCVIQPLTALAPREHYAACGALADVGPYVPRKMGGFPLAITERRNFMTDFLKGDGFGWQVFGERWEEFAGHSPWNYEPILFSDRLYKYLQSQHPSWGEYGYRTSKHYRDVRAYRIDDGKRFSYKTWGEFRGNARCEEYAGRKQPDDAEMKKYSQGRYNRQEWSLCNPAHNSLDEVLDMYLLFGDTRALECTRSIAAVAGAYIGMPDQTVQIHRATGWCMRSLMRYHDVLGEKEALPYVEGALDNFWKMARTYRNKPRIEYGGDWFYYIFGRSVVAAYNATGDERMRDLAIGLTYERTALIPYYPTLNAFCWDQTGQKKYFSTDYESRVMYGPYFTECSEYMWTRPRPDKEPPAAVKDLEAKAVGNDAVELTWRAPGDDGKKGTAAVYQIKYDDLPIMEQPVGTNTVHFWGAQNAQGEPGPQKAGKKELFTIKGLKPGTYWFAMKTRDEVNNESDISNLAMITIGGAVPPADFKLPKAVKLGEWADITRNIEKGAKTGKLPSVMLAIERSTGNLLVAPWGLGVWRSKDQSESFERLDGEQLHTGGVVHWGGFSTDLDGKGIAMFGMRHRDFGPCGFSPDGGKTWNTLPDIGFGWDIGAVDWASGGKNLIACRHEKEWVHVSDDGGKTMKQLEKKWGGWAGLGIFDANTYLVSAGSGVDRTEDGGKTWKKIESLDVCQGPMQTYKGKAYWLAGKGVMVSEDKGKTWTLVGSAISAKHGPLFGKNENNMIVETGEGFMETTDGCKTWKLVALRPIGHSYGNGGHSIAFDYRNRVLYSAQSGSPMFKCELE